MLGLNLTEEMPSSGGWFSLNSLEPVICGASAGQRPVGDGDGDGVGEPRRKRTHKTSGTGPPRLRRACAPTADRTPHPTPPPLPPPPVGTPLSPAAPRAPQSRPAPPHPDSRPRGPRTLPPRAPLLGPSPLGPAGPEAPKREGKGWERSGIPADGPSSPAPGGARGCAPSPCPLP